MNQKIPILLNCVAAVMGALGQYFYKKGSVRLPGSTWFLNGWILGGILSFCVVMFLFSLSYRYGGRMSVVYPFYATTFLWGALLGVFMEHEPWHNAYLVGLALIFSGITVIAWSSGRA